MDKNKIDKLFKEQLGNLEHSPSSDAWEKIAAGLDQKEGNNKVVIWYRYMAIAASLVILLVAGILFMRDTDNMDTQLASEIVADTTISNYDSVEIVVEKPIDSVNITGKPQVPRLKTPKIPKTYIAETKADQFVEEKSEATVVHEKPFIAFSEEQKSEIEMVIAPEEKIDQTTQMDNQSSANQTEVMPIEEELQEDQEAKGIWKKFKKLKKGENPELEKIKLETQKLIATITNTND